MLQQINNLIELALKYFALGLNVTAVIGKRPIHKWLHLLSARQTVEELRGYLWNTAKGVGAICGVNNLYCLDFDKLIDTKLLKEFLIYLSLPTNYRWVVQSGSLQGFHVWFKMEPDELNKLLEFLKSTSKVIVLKPLEDSWFKQVELRLNQHVVLPPSLHDSGNHYKFFFDNNDLSEPPINLMADQIKNFLTVFCQGDTITHSDHTPAEAVDAPQEVVNSSEYKKMMARVVIIEERKVDITGNYLQWIRLMFALINAFKLSAKEPLFRISQFYPTFSEKEFNEQFEDCYENHLKRKSGTKVTLATFYFICAKYGIVLQENKDHQNAEPTEQHDKDTPYYSPLIYSKLPQLLKDASAIYKDLRERDAFLITALAVISGILPNVTANYRRTKFAPPFFATLSAPPGSGKGVITDSRRLGQPIEDYFEVTYLQELEYYKQEKKRIDDGGEGEVPKKPIRKQLFLPANTSSTAIYNSIDRNGGFGTLVQEEMDCLAVSLGQEWGSFDDLLRSAWGHEPAGYNRVGLDVVVWIKWPRLAMALAGTLNQVLRLFPSSENGNFSRVVFYCWRRMEEFVAENGFLSDPDDLKENLISVHALKLLELYKILENHSGVFFCFTSEQGEKLTAAFQRSANKLSRISGIDVRAIIVRTMVVCSRLGMILSVLRAFESGKIERRLVCSDDDYFVICQIIKTSLEHSVTMLSTLPKDEHAKLKLETLEKVRFFDALPYGEFTHDDVVSTFILSLGIKQRTAESYLNDFVTKKLIKHIRNGVYEKR